MLEVPFPYIEEGAYDELKDLKQILPDCSIALWRCSWCLTLRISSTSARESGLEEPKPASARNTDAEYPKEYTSKYSKSRLSKARVHKELDRKLSRWMFP